MMYKILIESSLNEFTPTGKEFEFETPEECQALIEELQRETGKSHAAAVIKEN